MAEKEFNLLREPWIRVMRGDCGVEEVSVADALLHAHEYCGLAGELPTQDAAVLRLLLAVLHAVFERVNADGEDAEIETADDAFDRWTELWRRCRFPEAPLSAYFAEQEENFWLFHPTRPFWQISEIPDSASRPQSEPVQKLNGAVSESGNKARLFAERSGKAKTELSVGETARWLVCMNQYDDNTLKTGLGVALLGQFVAITAMGNSLFETLMLNFALLDRDGEPWEEVGTASWEKDIPFNETVRQIAYPHDPVAMLSYHSRYGKLVKINGKLVCYKSPKGGICYEQISRNEPMAMWKRNKKQDEEFLIRSLNGRQVWREFGTVIADKEAQSALVKWHSNLLREKSIKQSAIIRYAFTELSYDKSQHSSVDNIFSDSLSLHFSLLSELGEAYRQRITDMIERCDRIAGCIGGLAFDLFLASGGDTEKKNGPRDAAKERYYYAIDVPFRKWLASLDAADTAETRQAKLTAWCRQAESIANEQAENMVQSAGQTAFIGKMVSVNKEQKKYYSSSLAMQWYRGKMKKIDM